jgi:hypothetical protein
LNRPDESNALTSSEVNQIKVRNVALGIVLCVVATGATITVRAAAGEDEVKRVGAATTVVNGMMGARGKAIPGAILEIVLFIDEKSHTSGTVSIVE